MKVLAVGAQKQMKSSQSSSWMKASAWTSSGNSYMLAGHIWDHIEISQKSANIAAVTGLT